MIGWAARGAARVSVFGSFYGAQKFAQHKLINLRQYI
jgi:hypothetical protein